MPRQEGKTAAVRTYVPSFLTIKARQIHDWAENNIEARQQLPVLLRTLVHSTGREMSHVDFPGYDNAERHGPDGLIDAAAPTPWSVITPAALRKGICETLVILSVHGNNLFSLVNRLGLRISTAINSRGPLRNRNRHSMGSVVIRRPSSRLRQSASTALDMTRRHRSRHCRRRVKV